MKVNEPSSGIPATLGKRVAQLRERRGWTQRELADAADLSPTFLSEIENDRRNVGSAILLRVADALDASLDYLMRGEEQPVGARQPVTVPAALSRAAEEQGWSYGQTLALLQARQVVVARRSGAAADELSPQQWSRDQWVNFYERLFGA